MKKFYIFLLFICFILTKSAFAADAVLEWDENTDADYYVVYWSTDPDSFDEVNSMEVPSGDITFVELDDSSDGQEYYIAVKAFNECGNSSDYSDTVVSAHIPSDVSYGGDVTSKSIAAAQGEGGGCFIGSSFPK